MKPSRFFVLSLAFVGAHLAAQPIASTRTDGARASTEDESILLPEFSVEGSMTNDYAASETVTGSRVATSIRDLPYNVNVVTKEFLDDFAAYELAEQFAYTSGFGSQETEGFYNVRGITSSNQLRNGFTRRGLVDSGSIDRAEVIKGPAAAIYGQTAPGGVINIISRRPSLKPSREFRIMGGNLGHFRTDLAFSGPLTGKHRWGQTFYRATGAIFDREYEQRYRDVKQRSGTLSLVHRFNDRTNIFVEYDYIRRDMHRGQGIPYATRSVTLTARDATGVLRSTTFNQRLGYYATELFDFSLQGDLEFNDRYMHTGSAHLEHRFNRMFSLRAAASMYDRWFWRGSSAGDIFRVTDRSIPDREPRYQSIHEYGQGAQVDLLARYTTRKFAAIGHNTLFSFDYRFEGKTDWTRNLATADLTNPSRNVRTLFVDRPDYSLLPYDPVLFSRFTGNVYTTNDNYSFGVRHQSFALENRLIGVASVRYDSVDVLTQNRTTFVIRSGTKTATKYQFGLNYRVNPAITLYGSQSTSFLSTTSVNRFGEILPNEIGRGIDAGVKFSLFEQRLNGTVSAFYIDKENESVTAVLEVPVLDAAGNPVIDPATGDPLVQNITDNVADGHRRSKGVELDFNYALSQRLQLIGNIAYTDARRISSGRDIDLRGRWVSGTPRHAAGLAGRFAPATTGRLKGLSLTFGVRYRGHLFPDTLGGGQDLDKDNLLEINDGRRTVQLPGVILVDFGAIYRWKPSKSRYQHTFQLNLKNATDENYLTEQAWAADGRTILATYGLKF
jgi:iron complex outermembrane receptor protein